MIELSFTKLLLVAVIALLVLGPEKLPKAARMAGAMLRRARLGWDSVRSEVERELEIEEIRRAAKDAAAQADALRQATDAAAHAANASVSELREQVLQAPDAPVTPAGDPVPVTSPTASPPAALPAGADTSVDPVAAAPANEGSHHGEG